ncbi:MAG: hypothetical protein KC425_02340, partial [Anaerolineales bacterium]|nr:hypothetical protein [Anaerolineales bacterium]
MSEDFVTEEEDGARSGSSRPFLISAGVLTVMLIIAFICAWFLLFRGDGNGQAVAGTDVTVTVAARLTENAMIAVTNTAVAVTIDAMTQEASAALTQEAIVPTNTPPPTETPPPTSTPVPTDTPVVQPAEDETPEPGAEGTSVFETGDGESTPTPIAVSGGTGGTGDGTTG